MPKSQTRAALAPPLWRSIQFKLAVTVATGIVLAVLLSSGGVAVRALEREREARLAEMRAAAQVLASSVSRSLQERQRGAALISLRAIAQLPSITFAEILDERGEVFASLGYGVTLDAAENHALMRALNALFPFSQTQFKASAEIRHQGAVIGTVVIVGEAAGMRTALREELAASLIWSLAAGALGVALALRQQRRITRPIRGLTSAMLAARRARRLPKKLAIDADDETGVLVRSYNAMIDQIRARDRAIARQNEGLERTVEERTHELSAARDEAERANAAKSEFLAAMSHEIRTPMNGVMVMAELLAKSSMTAAQRRYADVIVRSGGTLMTVINDILDLSKLEAGRMEIERTPMSPDALIGDVMALFWERATSKSVAFASYVDPEAPLEIAADPTRLRQVVANLVNNALKFTDEGSVALSLEARAVESAHGPRARIEIAVADTGIGIPTEKIDTIFEAFSQADQSTTRRFGGTGLGLTICRRLMEAMGGEIWAESAPGEGSRFVIAFEADVIRAAENAAPRAAAPVALCLPQRAVAVALARALERRGLRTAFSPEALAGAAPGFAITDAATLISGVPDWIAGVRAICLSPIDSDPPTALLRTGAAADLLPEPFSRTDLDALAGRLESGVLRGAAALSEPEESPDAIPCFRGARVLAADDNAVNREVLSEALELMEVDADMVEDGAQALAAYEAGGYDLVFLDCSMPVMDGYEATRRMRAAEARTGARRTPIVALSANVAGDDGDLWRGAGMDAYIAKPFRLADLAGALRLHGVAERMAAPAQLSPQPAPETPPSDVLDPQTLRTLRGLEARRPGAMARVFDLFAANAPQAVETLEAAIREGEAAGIAKAAHALKSMSASAGATRLAAAAAIIEKAAAEAARGGAPAPVPDLEDARDALTEAIGAMTEARPMQAAG